MVRQAYTVQPEYRYADFQSWMANVIHQRAETAFNIAAIEINEMRKKLRDYEGGALKNHQIIKTDTMANNNFPPAVRKQLAEMNERQHKTESKLRAAKTYNRLGLVMRVMGYVAGVVLLAFDFAIGMLNHDSYKEQRQISKQWLKYFFNR